MSGPLANASVTLGPSEHSIQVPTAWLVWLGAYIVALAFSGVFVSWILRQAGLVVPQGARDAGAYIGKIEDVLIVTFVILGEYTALALVFAAKGIVRAKEGENASYYLLGTLANFAWALLAALLARSLVAP